MAFTYNPDLSTSRDKVRLALGDTDSANPLFQDAEIDALLALNTNVLRVAAQLADAQAAKYARLVSTSIDGASFSYSDLSRQFKALAGSLRKQANEGSAGGLGTPFVGGTSLTDMKTNDDNNDRPPSRFATAMHEDPAAAGTPMTEQKNSGAAQ